jgi:hypothetical protein
MYEVVTGKLVQIVLATVCTVDKLHVGIIPRNVPTTVSDHWPFVVCSNTAQTILKLPFNYIAPIIQNSDILNGSKLKDEALGSEKRSSVLQTVGTSSIWNIECLLTVGMHYLLFFPTDDNLVRSMCSLCSPCEFSPCC